MLHEDKELSNDSGRLSSYNNFTDKKQNGISLFNRVSPPSFKVLGLQMTINGICVNT